MLYNDIKISPDISQGFSLYTGVGICGTLKSISKEYSMYRYVVGLWRKLCRERLAASSSALGFVVMWGV